MRSNEITVIIEYGIPSDSVRKLTALFQIKISTAQLNVSNWNVIIFNKDNYAQIKSLQQRKFTIYIAVCIASSVYSGIL